jgi:hypothetical protein
MVLKASILAQFVIFMPFDVLFKVATQEAGLGVPGQLHLLLSDVSGVPAFYRTIPAAKEYSAMAVPLMDYR